MNLCVRIERGFLGAQLPLQRNTPQLWAEARSSPVMSVHVSSCYSSAHKENLHAENFRSGCPEMVLVWGHQADPAVPPFHQEPSE
jgi:hypothetical protein